MCATLELVMKIIERSYLQTLKKVIGTPDIKVITGVRRSGKSMLLSSFIEYVAQTVTDANIIHIDFNDITFEDLQEYHQLYDYIESHWLKGHQNFIMIDEVQMCSNFEKAINSLHNSGKYDIYLTGSNAFLLSSDLATLFTGRVFPIEIFPFSFAEYLDYHDIHDNFYSAFDDYLMAGGFAGSYVYDDLPEKYRYLANIYDTLILRDIQQKYKIQNLPLLQKVSDYLMDNISRLTTGRSITNTLNSDHQDTNNKTVGSYLSYLCNTFAFYKVKRYDVAGKAYLTSQDKYYLCDHTIKYAKLGTKHLDRGSAYENIVAVELLRRGYETYVGTLYDRKINFVATRANERLYIQVSYDISSNQTFTREVNSLLDIRDAYPKLLITRTHQPEQIHEGIRIIDIADWLLTE